MLISPIIMGPIMGIGLGTGMNDFDLKRAGFKNLMVAELLARTNPPVWEVLIASFGGLASKSQQRNTPCRDRHCADAAAVGLVPKR